MILTKSELLSKVKAKGKVVVLELLPDNKEAYLLTIYDQSEFDSVDDKTLKNIIEGLHSEQ